MSRRSAAGCHGRLEGSRVHALAMSSGLNAVADCSDKLITCFVYRLRKERRGSRGDWVQRCARVSPGGAAAISPNSVARASSTHLTALMHFSIATFWPLKPSRNSMVMLRGERRGRSVKWGVQGPPLRIKRWPRACVPQVLRHSVAHLSVSPPLAGFLSPPPPPSPPPPFPPPVASRSRPRDAMRV